MTTMSMGAWPGMPTPDQMQRAWQEFFNKAAAMPRVFDIAQRVRVGCSPTETVYREDKLRLLRYETDVERRHDTPLLVVFALVNRPYILDLKPGKSVVHHFISAGFDTYNIDWGVPTDADRRLGMKEYIEGYMDRVVDNLRERTGSEKVNILGYCMGGSMSAIYAALHPEKVENLTLLAAPVDWSSRDHLLAKWVDPKYFDVDALVDAFGNVPADMFQSAFTLLKPVANLLSKPIHFYEKIEDEKFLEDYFALETWLNDSVPLAGEMFRQFVKHCMQENRLIEGRLKVGGRLVDLRQITCPILNLMASKDHLVPCGQSLPFNDAVGSSDRKAINFPAGHIGLAVGRKAHRELWPEAVDWLAQRSTPV